MVRHRALVIGLLLPAALVGAMALVYAHAFTYPTFNPEHAFHYMLNSGLTWSGWAGHYVTTGEIFYRPTAYYTWYQVATRLVGWHDIYGFKLLALALFLALGLMIHRVGLILLDGDRLAAGLAALLFVVHPLMFIVVYEISDFDLLYQGIILAIVALVLNGSLTGPAPWPAAAACLLLYALGLTAKEQVVAVPGFLVLVLALDPEARRSWACRGVLAGMAALTVGYLLFNVPRMGYVATGDYRTGFNLHEFLGNLASGPLWLAHLFVTDSESWPWMSAIHDRLADDLYGAAVIALVGWYGARVALSGDRAERRRLLILCAFVASFMALPLYSGGRPWHYAVPLVGFVLIQARAAVTVIRLLPVGRARVVAVSVAALVPIALSVFGFAREMDQRLPMFRVCAEALLHPPVPAEVLPHGATILYATGPNSWVYGLGRLFRFAYLDPTLVEMIVPDIKDLTPEQAKAWREAPHAFYFTYDPDRLPAWTEHGAELRAALAVDRRPAAP